MTEVLSSIVGVFVVGYLLFKLMDSLDDEKHVYIKLVMMFGILSLLLLVPKALIDGNTTCEPVLNHTTTYVNDTNYFYTSYCIENTKGTANTFFGITNTLFKIVIGYTIIALALASFYKLFMSWKRRGGRT